MGRVAMGLLSGAGLFALVIGSAAAAQSTLPPPDAPETPATVSEPASGGEIVVTGSRIRRDPLSQEQPIVFVSDEERRLGDYNPADASYLNEVYNQDGVAVYRVNLDAVALAE